MTATLPDQSAQPATFAKRQFRSRIMLIGFALLVLSFAAFFVTTGFMQRDYFRTLGGPVSVTVRNDSDIKVRTDVWLGPDLTTLEMDPQEFGTIRFSPKKPEQLRIDVYSMNGQQITRELGPTFQPGQEVSATASWTNARALVFSQP
jgi:hypothetical protein